MEKIKKYYFSELIAKDVGVEEAIMFSNIYFWVDHNAKKESEYHFHEDTYWMFNTIRDFTEQYCFWTTSAIRRILTNLEKNGYIKTGVFNKYGYDKTKWYTVTEKAFIVAENDKEYTETLTRISEE